MVATPIGNLEDITLRAIRTLREVSLIAAEDTRRTAKLLRHYQIDRPTQSLHEHNERSQIPRLLSRLSLGESLAVVSDAGTPLLSDPGARLVQAALEQGYRVQAIPGPSAVLAALVSSGLVTSEFTFVGFPPSRSKDRKNWFNNLKWEGRPWVMFEAPHRIERSLNDMLEVVGDREVAICRELTKIHEELVKGPISTVLGRLRNKGEYTVIVSPQSESSRPDRPAPDLASLLSEFGRLTEFCGSRRAAVKELAHRHGLSSRETYERLEMAKQLLG